MKYVVEISNNNPNDLRSLNICKSLESCWYVLFTILLWTSNTSEISNWDSFSITFALPFFLCAQVILKFQVLKVQDNANSNSKQLKCIVLYKFWYILCIADIRIDNATYYPPLFKFILSSRLKGSWWAETVLLLLENFCNFWISFDWYKNNWFVWFQKLSYVRLFLHLLEQEQQETVATFS